MNETFSALQDGGETAVVTEKELPESDLSSQEGTQRENKEATVVLLPEKWLRWSAFNLWLVATPTPKRE